MYVFEEVFVELAKSVVVVCYMSATSAKMARGHRVLCIAAKTLPQPVRDQKVEVWLLVAW